MKIIEAIRSAPSDYAVYFLVTAYLESLRHFERTCGVPEALTRLPIQGAEDLAGRLRGVHNTAGAAADVPAAEVAAVFNAAVTRLGAGEDE
jgi:hypothetical protein